uniref:Uncharacterized protein n=1 Tax=Setaria italica TaxID=4555 RepID=K3ZLZ5_SETIT
MGPSIDQILVASILPPNFDIDRVDWSNITQEELDCTQLNACVTNFLRSTLYEDIQDIIFDIKEVCNAAHLIWALLMETYVKPEYSSQASSLPKSTPSNDEVDLCLMAKKKKKAKKGKNQKIEVSSSLVEELELLKSNHASLVYNQSSIEHVFVESYNDLVAQENDELMQEVERLKKDLSELKGKSQVQPSQDNHEIMVKKVEKGSTVTYSAPQHLKINKSKI